MFISKIIEIYTLEIKQSMYTYKGLISYLWALSHIIRMYYDQSHVISSLLLKSKFQSGLLISSGSVFSLQPSVCYPHRWGVWNYTELENNLLSKKEKMRALSSCLLFTAFVVGAVGEKVGALSPEVVNVYFSYFLDKWGKAAGPSLHHLRGFWRRDSRPLLDDSWSRLFHHKVRIKPYFVPEQRGYFQTWKRREK